jgi:hypothetical protein
VKTIQSKTRQQKVESATFLQRLKKAVLHIEPLLLILFVVIILRIPNLFEPYWYGDEGIYLTLGYAMKQGLLLYKEIIDHKTPLIYVFAAIVGGNQFWFKFLFLWWNIGMVTLFYYLASKIMKSKWAVAISTSIFALLTTLPAFEGNIVNGELLVTECVLAALTLLWKTIQHGLDEMKKTALSPANKSKPLTIGLAGVFMGLGMLIKVPGVFDAFAVGCLFVLFALSALRKKNAKQFWSWIRSGLYYALGILVPIILSILYFYTKGAIRDYFDFGLMYNFRYSQEFTLPFASPVLQFLFGMLGKTLIVAGIFVLFLVLPIDPMTRFLLLWTALGFYASMLSSRPYPHYMQQLFIPIVLFFGHTFLRRRAYTEKILFVCISIGIVWTLFAFHFGLYPTVSYYKNFMRYALKQQTFEQYRDSFNPLMPDTYAAATFIQNTTDENSRLFIWGTNPMLYALAKRVPAGRFTVSFHIKDFKAYDETMDSIRRTEPEIIVVMNGEEEFSALSGYLLANYVPVQTYNSFVVFRKVAVQ